MNSIRVVCISDLHTYQKSVQMPPGDLVVCAGDLTFRGYEHELKLIGQWFRSLPYEHMVTIAGNHDRCFEDSRAEAERWLLGEADERIPNFYYLQDNGIELEINGIKVKIWGSPWQPWFGGWAFNLRDEEDLKEKWKLIPKDTDILITHGPPYKLRDQVSDFGSNPGQHVGCRELRKALQRVRPKIHVFGHIHEGYGLSRWGDTRIVNASVNTDRYNPTNPPIVLDIFEDGTVQQASKI